jgi:hypothetical protein
LGGDVAGGEDEAVELAGGIAQRGEHNVRGEAGAVAADEGPFAFAGEAAGGEAEKGDFGRADEGFVGVAAEGFEFGADFVGSVEGGRVDEVNDVGGAMAQEFFGGGIKESDDAVVVGGDERESWVGEHGLAEAGVAAGVGEFVASARVRAYLSSPDDKNCEKTSREADGQGQELVTRHPERAIGTVAVNPKIKGV